GAVYSLFACRGSGLLARLCPVAARLPSAVKRSPLLAESLCYGRLPRQWQAVSALGGTSVGVDCVSNGGLPFLTGLH
ncbi:hypothetical protein P7K49_039696, partial [Saguinus oedipus]